MDQNEDSDYGNLPSSGKRKISPQPLTESTKKKFQKPGKCNDLF